jgi:hypothetical protein
MLKGDQLLAKVAQLKGASKSELAKACGYVSGQDNGHSHVRFRDFYHALLQAKGIDFGIHKAKSGERRSHKGRELTFKTHVHFNGNLMVGQAYTDLLEYRPGDQFRIELAHGEIRLVPIEPSA